MNFFLGGKNGMFIAKLYKVIVASPKATQRSNKISKQTTTIQRFQNYRKCKLLQPFLAKSNLQDGLHFQVLQKSKNKIKKKKR
jgi:hypothetical protein